jgi:hypothetical protein
MEGAIMSYISDPQFRRAGRPPALAVLTLILIAAASAQERFLKPVDEGPNDASFVAFRARVIKAVAAKDAGFIKSILYKDVHVDFGGGQGVADFLKTWKNLRPSSEFWKEFGWALAHGGSFSKGEGPGLKQFWAPYTFSSWPEDLDSFEYAAITGDRVRLRTRPDSASGIASYLDYNIVKPKYDNTPAAKWVEVTTLGGQRGFVAAEFVRSPIAYRAGFSKINGKWRLASFVAGD